jgi:hypothetical protein
MSEHLSEGNMPLPDYFYHPPKRGYAATLAHQNTGGFCEHCNSHSGHFGNCPLINREAAEVASVSKGELDIPDTHFLKALHIKWEE